MDIVEQTARMIDPGAFSEWISMGEVSELEKARTAYNRSKAICTAASILKLACKQKDLKKQLIECELNDWRKLGVPVDSPELRKTVELKY